MDKFANQIYCQERSFSLAQLLKSFFSREHFRTKVMGDESPAPW